eukprot:3959850-Pyramimonas_sp.AAC.1
MKSIFVVPVASLVFFVATAARDSFGYARKQRVMSVRESGGADGPSDGQADAEGPALAKARPRTA